MVDETRIRSWYNKWISFWPTFDWPDFEDIDFGFRKGKAEWGSCEWLPDGGIRLSLDPSCQRDSGQARATLAHELNHVYLGPKVGHGKKFNEAMLAALNRGLIYESLI